jgi:hypothetical protein
MRKPILNYMIDWDPDPDQAHLIPPPDNTVTRGRLSLSIRLFWAERILCRSGDSEGLMEGLEKYTFNNMKPLSWFHEIRPGSRQAYPGPN